MLYTIADDKGEQRREIEASDVESAALEWADRINPLGAVSGGQMFVTVTDPNGAAVSVEVTSETEIHYYALRLDD